MRSPEEPEKERRRMTILNKFGPALWTRPTGRSTSPSKRVALGELSTTSAEAYVLPTNLQTGVLETLSAGGKNKKKEAGGGPEGTLTNRRR